MTILDNVFVPWERVFLYKDVVAGSQLALMFALQHRLSALSYRYALAEYLIGLGKLVAEANGVQKASHIIGDLKDLITYAEIQKICAKMACYECQIDETSGIAIPNVLKVFTARSRRKNLVEQTLLWRGGASLEF
jgi:aromatic ring hydroxylase